MNLALAILPIALTLAAGWALVATKILPKDQWHPIEILSFRLLIPVILIDAISSADLSVDQFGGYVLALVATLAVSGAVVMALRPVFSKTLLPNPSFTTLFQTTTRWNGFIALAAAELMIGDVGLTLIALAMAALIPLINIINIVVLASFGTGKMSAGNVFLTIAKNPLVQGCAIGIGINVSGVSLPVAIEGAIDLIGRAALGVGLLAVGAGISFKRLLTPNAKIFLGLVLRQILGPTVFIVIALALGLPQIQVLAGVLVLAVPAASNGYIVAKQMGGDAELYAGLLTWQTIVSLGLLPLLAALLSV